MAVKTITITEKAYQALASEKKEGESFSELILRTHEKKGNIESLRKFIGAWNHIPDKVIDDMKKDIEDRRRDSGKRMKEILKHFN